VKGQHEAVRTVADRQKTQTFRQEGKQLGVLAAARQQKDRLQETGYRNTGYRKTGDRETKSS
jgi:hypothetical protein